MNWKESLLEKKVTLIAVSKTYPSERILEEYNRGQRIFGENKVQELTAKYETLPKDIDWHFIGHLQRNKVKYMAPFIHTIHAVDSFELLEEINKQAQKHQRTIRCLLQFHVAQEETKFGLSETEAIAMLEQNDWRSLAHVQLAGVMGMATFTDDTALITREFRQLKQIFTHIQTRFFDTDPHFKEISMGMSGDWEIAVGEGSTMVRIGSLIFGQRH